MKRLITKRLSDWKNNLNRKPLIVRGARQVGKTYTIKEFGEKNYKNSYLIDLERNPELKLIFSKNKDPKRIISELELFLNRQINIKTDLLIIDEIQNAPDALASLRYFYEELPNLNLIAAGSLIEFAVKDISFPVGRVETISMHPMNFEEFLIALNKNILVDHLNNNKNKNQPELFHEYILEELKKYFLVGGMPEAVKVYLGTGSFIAVESVHKNLMDTYRQDFSKYAGRADKRCLDEVLISSAKNVGKQTKYVNLAKDFSIPTIKNAYNLLLKANIINKVESADPSGLPLGSNVSTKIFKTIFLDIGLMNRVCELNLTPVKLKNDLLSLYRGALAEQFVGQEMLSAGSSQLFYWTRNARNSSAEVDYLFSRENSVIPIEVKSGPSGKLKSMHMILKNYKNIQEGFVLSTAKYSTLPEQKIKFIPLYYTSRIMKEKF